MPRKDLHPRQRLDAPTRTSAIIDAAADCFTRRPYAEVTVAEIAAAAGASEPLVYRYFATKATLYAAVVRHAVTELGAAQRAAIAALHPLTPVHAKIRASLGVYLDHIEHHPRAWADGLDATQEPPEALVVRTAARETYVTELAGLLSPNPGARHRYALWGYFGFLDGACLAWTRAGCPADERSPLIEAALGSLQGALGDWAA
ncbi:MAG: TetR/AcrR family transcriptional regulator [Propionibacteriaceae bacterium]|jgi:AcrR family transcriptional regulator|nr:TetR/AcrR family transcriptional regulator [Propionibacteriaceae bacterium]